MIMHLAGESWDVVDAGNGEATYTLRGTHEGISLVCTVRPGSFAYVARVDNEKTTHDSADFWGGAQYSLRMNLTGALDTLGELENAASEDDYYSHPYEGDTYYDTDTPDSDLWNEY
jgi:hypothetical protein